MGEPPSAKQGINKSIFLQDKTDQHKKKKKKKKKKKRDREKGYEKPLD
jgi:AAA15 family ATPase/GTPase